MVKNFLNTLCLVLFAFVLGAFGGYFGGRNKKDAPAKIQRIYTWTKGKEIVKEIPVNRIVYKTIEKEVPIPTDTAALYRVWCDYHNVNKYAFDFSDDSVGVFKVNFDVTENRVSGSPRATIQPNILTIEETKTIYKVPYIQGYVLIGTSVDLGTNQIQAGIDIKQRYLVGMSGIRMNDNWGYTVNLGIKF